MKISYHYYDADGNMRLARVDADEQAAIQAAIDWLDYVVVDRRGRYHVRDPHDRGRLAVVTADHIAQLGAAVLDGRGDAAYSLWLD
jgi:hypothetical protein